MSAPNMSVNSFGDALALSGLPQVAGPPTGYVVGLYTANGAANNYAAVLGDLTEPLDVNYSRQPIAFWTGPADDGTGQFRQQLSGTQVNFPAFAAPDTILGRFILTPAGDLYALGNFVAPISMGPLLPGLAITPALTMKSEI